MLPADVFRYTLLTIIISASGAIAENQTENAVDKQLERRVSKRETTLLFDSYPAEASYRPKAKVIYRRASKQKYVKSKPRYGPPKPRQNALVLKPVKKLKVKSVKPKYSAPRYKKPKPNTKYGPYKPSNKPNFGSKAPYKPYYPSEPAGFGEPPHSYGQEFQPPHEMYADPVVDSYGAPLNMHSPEPSFTNPEEYMSWHSYQRDKNLDNDYAYSKKHPSYVNTDKPEFTASDYQDDYNLNTYSDVFKFSNKVKPTNPYEHKIRPAFFSEDETLPWKQSHKNKENDVQMVVGGQYAEPPARYVAKFQPSAPMHNGDEDFIPPKGFSDMEVSASSVSISPYVNYKNGNIAFSPQNLNDAFSI